MTNNLSNLDVIIIGGGAAGIMAAISSLECNKKVLLIEKFIMVIPFIYFMNELMASNDFKRVDYIYATLFVLIFAAYPIHRLGSSGMLYISLYLLLAVLLIEQAVQVVKNIHQALFKARRIP